MKTLPHDWFSAPLPENVFLGKNTYLYSTFAFRHYCSRRPIGLLVGDNTGLYNGTFFDLGHGGEVAIGNYCTLVGAIINTHCRIEIADCVFIAHEVVLSDEMASMPPSCKAHLPHVDAPIPSIQIGRNAWIGARAILLKGARIGENAIVGAGAVIDFSVPPNAVAAGNPARIVGKIDMATHKKAPVMRPAR